MVRTKAVPQHISVLSCTKNEYICVECGERYTYKSALFRHIRKEGHRKRRETPEKNANGSHICEECGKQYAYFSGLCRHIASQHKNKRYICAICNGPFRRKSYLREHLEEVHKVNDLVKQ